MASEFMTMKEASKWASSYLKKCYGIQYLLLNSIWENQKA